MKCFIVIIGMLTSFSFHVVGQTRYRQIPIRRQEAVPIADKKSFELDLAEGKKAQEDAMRYKWENERKARAYFLSLYSLCLPNRSDVSGMDISQTNLLRN